jgi:GNAT superfamily N-acetyltransferase
MTDTAPMVTSQPEDGDIRFLDDRINEFNYAATGYTDGALLASFVRDEQGAIVAGMYGWTWGGCCEIRYLWVQEPRRGQGYGSRLLQAAEHEAKRRGCTQVVLDTHSFQAPDFYRRHGYEVVGSVEGYPRGYQKIYLRKRLG